VSEDIFIWGRKGSYAMEAGCEEKLGNKNHKSRLDTIGIRAAIISIVTTLTVILAVLSVIGHCLAIFWPRKPLTTPVDENGFPILWCNNDEKQENVACVWGAASEEPAADLAVHGGERRSA
jgi:hypothetical protein